MIGRLLLLATGLLAVHRVASDCDDYNYDDDCGQSCVAPLISDGAFVASDGNNKFEFDVGESARLVCDDGYRVRGQQVAQCQDDFTWNWSQEPVCEMKPPPAPRCTARRQMDRGMFIIREETVTVGSATYFSKLIIKCYEDQDYYLHGGGTQGEYVCEGTQWKGQNFCLKRRVCPRIRVPKNGNIRLGNLNSRNVGDEIHFGCNSGYTLHGQRRWKCESSLYWTGDVVYCEKDLGLLGVAKIIKENVDRFSAQSSTSSSRGRLSASHANGIDLFFLVDRSDSISSDDFTLAKDFIKMLVDFFGISSKGGATRLAVISFGSDAELRLSFDQVQKMEECIIKAKVDGHDISDVLAGWANKCRNVTVGRLGGFTRECVNMLPSAFPAGVNKTEVQKSLERLVKDKIQSIQAQGGGTALIDAVTMIAKMPVRCGAEKAAFLLTDGRDNMVSDLSLDAMLARIRSIGKKDNQLLEVFAVGIGQDLRLDQLTKVASEPKARHVFRLRDYKELKELTNLMIVTKNDYTQCGVSMVQRNEEVKLNSSVIQKAKPRTWPWLVKISVDQGGFRCGGALIAENYVLTAASCLYNEHNILQTPNAGTAPVEVTTGFYSENRTAGLQNSTSVALYVHEDFNIQDPMKNNIALVKIQDGLKLDPFTRKLCLPGQNEAILMHKAKKRWLVGWNSALSSVNPLITMTDKPWERVMDLISKQECNQKHSGTASESYLQCMGDRHKKLGHSAGDKGGPIVVQSTDIDGKPIFKMVAMVTDGTQTEEFGKFTIVTEIAPFMNWINKKTSQ